MEGGVFGASEHYRDRRMQTKTRLARKLLGREEGSRRNEVNPKPSTESQVWHPVKLPVLVTDVDRVCYLPQTPTLSSTTTQDVTLANFPKMAISSSLVHRTSGSACTTLRIHTIGNITKQSFIQEGNGLLPTHR